MPCPGSRQGDALRQAKEGDVVWEQVTTTVPGVVNKLLLGVPTTVDVQGLQLNTSLARSPAVTPQKLTVWDWGRFQNPDLRWQVRWSVALSEREHFLVALHLL